MQNFLTIALLLKLLMGSNFIVCFICTGLVCMFNLDGLHQIMYISLFLQLEDVLKQLHEKNILPLLLWHFSWPSYILVSLLSLHLSQPQLSVQPSSQQEPGRGLEPPPPFQQTLPSEVLSETHQPTQLQLELQLSESNPEHQDQAKPLWIKHRRLLLLLLGFSFCAAIVALIYYMHHNLQNRTNNQAGTGRIPEKKMSQQHDQKSLI